MGWRGRNGTSPHPSCGPATLEAGGGLRPQCWAFCPLAGAEWVLTGRGSLRGRALGAEPARWVPAQTRISCTGCGMSCHSLGKRPGLTGAGAVGGVGRMGGGCLRPMRPELRPLLIPPQGHSADPEYPPFMELSLHVLALFFVSAFFFLILVLFFFF